ncbi:hypothetical protein KSP40_PGU009958 [Platanthera guangdongensis]|uniref:Uncharacterized protein n=1 Tax=Platanthera guangdongensis TaxID=2320717 RepID=A0ABR2M8E2_9ASPA
MAETLTPVSDPTLDTPDYKDFVPETIYDLLSEDWKSKPAPEKKSNGYIALDVAKLSILAPTAGEINKALSRKGFQRGMERKPPEFAAAAAAVSATGGERSPYLLHVSCVSDRPTTPTAEAVVGAGRFRRLSFRRSSPWLDPRRVLVFFASLSSLGTMILLYFTLSMRKYSGR